MSRSVWLGVYSRARSRGLRTLHCLPAWLWVGMADPWKRETQGLPFPESISGWWLAVAGSSACMPRVARAEEPPTPVGSGTGPGCGPMGILSSSLLPSWVWAWVYCFHLLPGILPRCAAAAKSRQSCPTPCDPIDGSPPGSHPWDSPGKNTGVGCHFLLQCMKVKSESEVAQSCPTLRNPMDYSLPGSSVHGIFQARVLEWGARKCQLCIIIWWFTIGLKCSYICI